LTAMSTAHAFPLCILNPQNTNKCNGGPTACIMVWPDGYQGVSKYDYMYNIALFICTYLLPMAGLLLSYLQMGLHLHRSERGIMANMLPHPAVLKSRYQKKRLVKMFGVVVAIFMVCWAPYHIYFILSFHFPHITRKEWISNVYLAFYWLAMANSCVNPVIYYWMNARFREYFDKVLFGVPRLISWARKKRLVSEDARQSCGDLMVDLGEQNISNIWDRGPSLHVRCPRAGLPPLEDQVVGSWGLVGPCRGLGGPCRGLVGPCRGLVGPCRGLDGSCRGQQGGGISVSCYRSRGVLPSLISQDSLLSQQTVLTHMCEELI